MTHRTDYTYLSRRRSAVNHLKNGNFLNIPKDFTPELESGLFGDTGYKLTRVRRTTYHHKVETATGGPPNYTYTPTVIPGFAIESEAPVENFIGYWDVWGALGYITFDEEHPSFDGGNLVRVLFNETGVVYFKQTIESFNKFRGKPVTMGLSGASVFGNVKITLTIDVGSEVLESRPYFSQYFGSYSRLVDQFEVPLDISKFDVIIKIEAKAGRSAEVSGAILSIGSYAADLPYSDSISDVAIPSGTVIGWLGEVCPQGFRAMGEDTYLHAGFHDPNAFRGNLFDQSILDETHGSLGKRGSPVVGDNGHVHQAHGSGGTNVIEGIGLDPLYIPPSALYTDRDNIEQHDVNRIEDFPTPITVTPARVPLANHRHLIHWTDSEDHPIHAKIKFCEKL